MSGNEKLAYSSFDMYTEDTYNSFRTDSIGEANIKELKIGKKYTIDQTSVNNAYYLAEPVSFEIIKENNGYKLVVEGNEEDFSINQDGVLRIEGLIRNEKIPTYSLIINKVGKVYTVGENGLEETKAKLQGAKFDLINDGKVIKKYETDQDGKIVIPELIQHEEGRTEKDVYTLREVATPEGYSKVKDITFRAEKINGQLVLTQFSELGDVEKPYSSNEDTVELEIEDQPVFKLIKKDKENQEPLFNTKFAFYNLSEGRTPAKDSKGEIIGQKEVINEKEYYIVETDGSGEIRLDLPEGTYLAKEIVASDEKYQIDEHGYTFSIGETLSPYKSLEKTGYTHLQSVGMIKSSNYNGGYHSYIYFFNGTYYLRVFYDDGNGERLLFERSILRMNGGWTYQVFSIDIDENGTSYYSYFGKNNTSTKKEYVSVTRDNVKTTLSTTNAPGDIRCINGDVYWLGQSVSKLNSNGRIVESINLNSYFEIVDMSILDDGRKVLFANITALSENYQIGEYDFTPREPLKGYNYSDGVIIILNSENEIIQTKKIAEEQDRAVSFVRGRRGDDNNYYVLVNNSEYNKMTIGESKADKEYILVCLDENLNELWAANTNDALSNPKILKDGRVANITGDVYSIEDQNRLISKNEKIIVSSKGYLYTDSSKVNDGFIIHGSFDSEEIKIGENIIELPEDDTGKYFIIKTNNNFDVQWYKIIDYCNRILINKNGRIITEELTNNSSDKFIKVYSEDGEILNSIQGENYEIHKYNDDNSYVISYYDSAFRYYCYDENNNIIWEKENYEEESEIPLEDGSVIRIYGEFLSNCVGRFDSNGNMLWNISHYVGSGGGSNYSIEKIGEYFLIKCNAYYNDMVWIVDRNGNELLYIAGDNIISQGSDLIYILKNGTITRIDKLEYSFSTREVNALNGECLANGNLLLLSREKKGDYSLLKLGEYKPVYVAKPLSEITIENAIKEFNINTRVEYDEDVYGDYGEISGCFEVQPFETVKYGETTTKEIEVIPYDGCEIEYIKVNNEKIDFTPKEDGSYVLDKFENVREDIDVSAKFIKKDSKFTITKLDKDSREALEGAEILIQQLEDRLEPDNSLIIGEKTDEGEYGFILENGKYISSNNGINDSFSKSIIEINLEGLEGFYEIVVNAEISSEQNDFGFIDVRNDYFADNLAILSGNQEAKDYSCIVEGGQKYNLIIEYDKDIEISEGSDELIINNINIKLDSSHLYKAVRTTDKNGKIVLQIPYGTFKLSETKAPEGYFSDGEEKIVLFDINQENEIVLENQRAKKVTVHHYLKDNDGNYTTEKIYDDVVLFGKEGDSYSTNPLNSNEEYELEKDAEDEYIIPSNAFGVFETDDIEVNYYYENIGKTLKINHYIEGTENPVILANGEQALSVIERGIKGEKYTTSPILEENLYEDYELAAIPDNAIGLFGENDEVTYIYRLKTFDITTEVITTTIDVFNTMTNISEEEEIKGGTISGEGQVPYEIVPIKQDSQKELLIVPEQGFKVEKVFVNDEEINFNVEGDGNVKLEPFTNVMEDKHIKVKFAIDESKVIVHHYLENTEDRIKDHDGNDVDDVEKHNYLGNIYITKPREDLYDRYELVDYPENSSGTYGIEDTEVIFYYRLKDATISVNHYIMNSDGTKTENPVPLKEEGKFAETETINIKIDSTYETNPISEEELDENYELVETPINSEGSANTDSIAVNYYYMPKETSIIVYYKEKDTEKDIYESTRIDGHIFDSHTIRPIDIENYVYVGDEDSFEVILKKDVTEITLYYVESGNSFVEKHVDSYTNEIISQEVHEDIEIGDEYKIDPKEFENYELDESKLPENASGTVEKYPVVVIYYYKHKAEIITRYIDVKTDEVIEETKDSKFFGDGYEVNSKDITAYDLDEERLPNNSKGTVESEEIVVNYYYKHKAKVIENHIDADTEEKIEQNEYNGHTGDRYVTTSKEIESYDLVEERFPDNARGEMTNETIEVNYYYKKQAEVVVEYLDFYTGKKLNGNTTYHGHVGEEYEVSSKDIEGYKLLESQKPTNSKGTMTKDPIIVTFFYIKETKVTERHMYNGTTLYEEIHNGLEGEEYDIKSRTFDNYILDEEKLPSNSKGYMEEKEIVVTYYYVEKAVVIEKHIDEDTKEILAYEKHEGKIGDTYRTKARKFPGYSDEYSSTDNNMGLMTKEPIEVVFWYKKSQKQTTPAEEVPKAQEPAQAPVTVIIKDGSGSKTTTTTTDSRTSKVVTNTPNQNTVVKNVTTNTATKERIDNDVARNVPDTESETNRVFYIASSIIVLIGMMIVTVVGFINKKKSKE